MPTRLRLILLPPLIAYFGRKAFLPPLQTGAATSTLTSFPSLLLSSIRLKQQSLQSRPLIHRVRIVKQVRVRWQLRSCRLHSRAPLIILGYTGRASTCTTFIAVCWKTTLKVIP